MSRRLRDKYRRRHIITQPGIIGSPFDEVSEEKLIKVSACDNLDSLTVINIEVKTIGQKNWTNLKSLDSTTREVILDISLYDQIRYNVFTFGGATTELEAVSAVHSDQNVILKDIDDNDALRVLQGVPLEGDSVAGLLNTLVTLQFWQITGFDTGTLNFIVKNDESPIIDNQGNFVVV